MTWLLTSCPLCNDVNKPLPKPLRPLLKSYCCVDSIQCYFRNNWLVSKTKIQCKKKVERCAITISGGLSTANRS